MYKVVTWNSGGLKNKVLELNQFLINEKVDIAIITELKLKNSDKLKVSNFITYRSDRLRNRGSGVAMLVKQSIPHLPLDNIDSLIDNISIKLSDNTVIRGVYNSPSHRITDLELEGLLS